MSARCLRCGAGNEWIEGSATHRAPATEAASADAPKESPAGPLLDEVERLRGMASAAPQPPADADALRVCVIKVWGRDVDVVALYRERGFTRVLPSALTMTGAMLKTSADVPWDRMIVRETGIEPIGDNEAVTVSHGDIFHAIPRAYGDGGGRTASARPEAPVSEPTPTVDEVERGAALRAERDALREALQGVFDLIDDGVLVRNVADDAVAMKYVTQASRLVNALAKARAALDADPEAKPTPSSQDELAALRVVAEAAKRWLAWRDAVLVGVDIKPDVTAIADAMAAALGALERSGPPATPGEGS